MDIILIIGLTILGFAAIIFDIMVIPGGVVIAVGVGVIGYAVFLTYDQFGLLPAVVHGGICLALVPVIIIWSLRRVSLKGEMTVADGYVGVDSHTDLIGTVGIAFSDLRPSGTVAVEIEGHSEHLDCIAESGFIEKGSEVVIAEERGPSLVVRRHTRTETAEVGA